MFSEVLTKVMFAPFCVMVPEVEVNAFEIFIAPEERVNPFELFKVRFFKLLVPDPAIVCEDDPNVKLSSFELLKVPL